MIGREAELLHVHRSRCRRTEPVDPDGCVGVALPPERGRGLDRQPGDTSWQYLIAIPPLPARQTAPSWETTRPGRGFPRARGRSRPRGTAGPRCRSPISTMSTGRVCMHQDIGTVGDTIAGQGSTVSASTGRSWRLSTSAVGPLESTAICHAAAVSLASAGRITRRPGHGPQRCELLDGLVGRAVLAEADRVVGEEVDDMGLREGREAHGRTAVVAEDEERAARQGARPRAVPSRSSTAAMACSRIPKWTWSPPGCAWDWASAPAPRSAPVLPVRSPAPATRPGIFPP